MQTTTRDEIITARGRRGGLVGWVGGWGGLGRWSGFRNNRCLINNRQGVNRRTKTD